MPKQMVLACTCGDCVHWEIVGDAVTPHASNINNVTLLCKTCGGTFKASLQVDPHEKLVEIEREVPEVAVA